MYALSVVRSRSRRLLKPLGPIGFVV
jgi:hypothetical protein